MVFFAYKKLAQFAVRCALPPRRSESPVCATDNKPSCVLPLLGWFIGLHGFSSLERRPEFWVLHLSSAFLYLYPFVRTCHCHGNQTNVTFGVTKILIDQIQLRILQTPNYFPTSLNFGNFYVCLSNLSTIMLNHLNKELYPPFVIRFLILHHPSGDI